MLHGSSEQYGRVVWRVFFAIIMWGVALGAAVDLFVLLLRWGHVLQLLGIG